MPASGRGEWIDSGLAPRDRDRPGGDLCPRYLAAWELELLGERSEITPARHEPEEKDAVDRPGMDLDDLCHIEAQHRRHGLQVRSVVNHGYAVEAAGFCHRRPLGREAPDGRRERVVRYLVGIEMNCDAGVAGDRLPHVSPFLQGPGQRDGPCVERSVKPRPKLREERGITERVGA